MYSNRPFLDVFARSGLYRLAPAAAPAVLREDSSSGAAFPYSERHLRCVWTDPAYRPAVLPAAGGQTVSIENPGRWNLEAGPDFLDAVLRVEPGARRLCGDVEIHIRPCDWTAHAHANDPRYARLVAHVTYFPGAPVADLPAGTIEIPLRDSLKTCRAFSFETIDLTAYPYGQQSDRPPCGLALRQTPVDAWETILEAAGEERLRRKAERLAAVMREKNPAQTFYEETLCGLGYKHNRGPFRALAERLPVDTLARLAGPRVGDAYALLSGVAGLIPAKAAPAWDDETRQFIRGLWDFWWKHREGLEPVTMSRRDWTLANLRPPNHPLRRLMAAAVLFRGPANLPGLLESLDPQADTRWMDRVMRGLQDAGLESFWAHRQGLSGARLGEPMALIGAGRAAALLTNVVLPWLVACGKIRRLDAAAIRDLPAEDDNRLVRHTAHALFGHDHNPALYRSGLRQQGLLQIFHDFCLNARSGCQSCAFSQLLDGGTRG